VVLVAFACRSAANAVVLVAFARVVMLVLIADSGPDARLDRIIEPQTAIEAA
jgi:hypothetical protein